METSRRAYLEKVATSGDRIIQAEDVVKGDWVKGH